MSFSVTQRVNAAELQRSRFQSPALTFYPHLFSLYTPLETGLSNITRETWIESRKLNLDFKIVKTVIDNRNQYPNYNEWNISYKIGGMYELVNRVERL